jgi:hypothetical protein
VRDYWQPAVRGIVTHSRRPEVGALIAFDRKAWHVVEVRERDPIDWSDRAREQWLSLRMPEAWEHRPYVAILRPASGGRSQHLGIEPWHYGWWENLPEHYAVCVSCGELAPCSEITAERSAKREMERFERLARVLPGCCWACSEPITHRQEARTFPGANVWMPTAGDSPRFHMRRACRDQAARYEEDWVQADPTRPRSRLTLRCAGTLVVHANGEAECFGAVDSACPDIGARHGSMTACYAQSLGCPKGCAREGHPGARPKIAKEASP